MSDNVVNKCRNRLHEKTIVNIMQYKRWVFRHGIVVPENDDESAISESEDIKMDTDSEDKLYEDEEEYEENTGIEE